MTSARLLTTLPLAPYMLDKLRGKGFVTQRDVLELQPVALAQELGVSGDEALAIRRAVTNNTYTTTTTTITTDKSEGRSALEILNHKNSRQPVFTMNRELDDMLGGGVARGEVTEFCGVPGMGKTQLAIQLTCDVQIPKSFHGPEGKAVYIDTEGSFMAERAYEIAQGLVDHLRRMTEHLDATSVHRLTAEAMTAKQLLGNIYYFRVYDYVEQIATIKALSSFLATAPDVRLVVIDSVAFHFRRDFDDMALRARLLTGLAQDLLALAERHDLAVVLTNQVTTKIRSHKASHLVPALGESWAHACTSRCMFMWKDNQRVARLIKSPSMRDNECFFAITTQGVRGVGGGSGGGKKRQRDGQDEAAAAAPATS